MPTTETTITTDDPPVELVPYLDQLSPLGVKQLHIVENTIVAYCRIPSGVVVVAEGFTEGEALDRLIPLVKAAIGPVIAK